MVRSTFEQPIITASGCGIVSLVQLMIDNGADANWISDHRQTPIDIVDRILQGFQKHDYTNVVELKADVLEKKLAKLDKDSWEYDELMVKFALVMVNF
jgi:hypothetical protein